MRLPNHPFVAGAARVGRREVSFDREYGANVDSAIAINAQLETCDVGGDKFEPCARPDKQKKRRALKDDKEYINNGAVDGIQSRDNHLSSVDLIQNDQLGGGVGPQYRLLTAYPNAHCSASKVKDKRILRSLGRPGVTFKYCCFKYFHTCSSILFLGTLARS